MQENIGSSWGYVIKSCKFVCNKNKKCNEWFVVRGGCKNEFVIKGSWGLKTFPMGDVMGAQLDVRFS